MRRFTHHGSVVTIGNEDSGIPRPETLVIEQGRQQVRNRPEESVAIIEIVDPFLVAEQIGAADLDLDDRQFPFGPDRHQIRAPAVGQRHFAHGEQILPAEQARHAARHLGRDGRSVDEAIGNRAGGHAGHLEQKGGAANPADERRPFSAARV